MSTPTMVNGDAPAERLAAFRIVTGSFALGYLVLRLPVFLRLGQRNPDDFAPVGLARWLPEAAGQAVVTGAIVVALVSGIGYVAGAWFRLTGPLFAVAMLMLCTYRSSWGQLLHFENLMVLHLLIVSVAASADAWSIDARRTKRRTPRRQDVANRTPTDSTPTDSSPTDSSPTDRASPDYSAPLRLACIVVVVSYVIAGIAKLRYGGIEWIAGDTLRNHVAYSAARLELLGGTPSPLARPFVEASWLSSPFAAAAVAIELAAPMALLGRRYCNGWVVAAWFMHVGIAALMYVAFAYPLSLVAFAPFFALERVVEVTSGRFHREAGRSRLIVTTHAPTRATHDRRPSGRQDRSNGRPIDIRNRRGSTGGTPAGS